MLIPILLMIVGLVVLVVGAEALVRGASGLAKNAGISSLVIGLTVVAFGTSAPELAVSIKSTLAGAGDIAIGNIAGSNLFNVGVILGLSALICPLVVNRQVVRLDMPIMLLATALFIVFCLTQSQIGRLEGGVLFAGVVAYTAGLLWMSRRESRKNPAAFEQVEILGVPEKKPGHPVVQALIGLAGLGLLILGAKLLVDNAVAIAAILKIPEAIVGLTIVAAGTSLPELATSVVAAIKKETDVAVGNIVGSNIFNLLCIGGAAGMVRPVQVGGIDKFDFLAVSILSVALLPLMKTGFRLQRWEGAVLLAMYGGYLAYRWP